jgi:hypothetical protein
MHRDTLRWGKQNKNRAEGCEGVDERWMDAEQQNRRKSLSGSKMAEGISERV